MDPNKNLKEQRELAKELVEDMNDMPDSILEPKVERLAELVCSLDEWLSKGGFFPNAWDGIPLVEAKQLQEIAVDLAQECGLHPLSVTITTRWDPTSSDPDHSDWKMVWIASIGGVRFTKDGTVVLPSPKGQPVVRSTRQGTIRGESDTPMGACLKAREALRK